MKRNAQTPSWGAWKHISVLLAALLSVLFLTACATTGTEQTLGQKVTAPEQCLQSPESPPPLADPATLADAVRNHALAMALYWQLAEWHECLIMWERGR